jgi:hypothetical protein
MEPKLTTKQYYLNRVNKEIENSVNISDKYKTKIRIEHIRNKIQVNKVEIEELEKELILLEQKLNEILTMENETLPNKLKKYNCVCGSVIQMGKLKLHQSSKKHCLWLDSHPEHKDII